MQLEKHGNKWDYGKRLSPWTLQAGTDLTVKGDGKRCVCEVGALCEVWVVGFDLGCGVCFALLSSPCASSVGAPYLV